MGLDTSIVAPAVALASRRWRGRQFLTWPASLALPSFLAVHIALTAWMTIAMPSLVADLGFQVALTAASVVFWLPVLAATRRLSDAGRCVYLFLAMPAMDLAGVFVVLHGDPAGGLAMIVAMLPVGVAAVVSTWRWMAIEEAAAARSPADRIPVLLGD